MLYLNIKSYITMSFLYTCIFHNSNFMMKDENIFCDPAYSKHIYLQHEYGQGGLIQYIEM